MGMINHFDEVVARRVVCDELDVKYLRPVALATVQPVAFSEAKTVKQLVEDYNELLEVLKNLGVIV